MNWWTFLASLVGPTIAALALRHAVKRADAQVREWRIQKLAERDADVAVKALQMTLRYAQVIVQATFAVTLGRDARSEEELFNDRWAMFDKLDNDFNDMIWLVRAQLGDAEADAMDAIWHIKSRVKANQLTWMGAKYDTSLFERGFGSKATEDLDAADSKVRELLKPHIRMEAVKKPLKAY